MKMAWKIQTMSKQIRICLSLLLLAVCSYHNACGQHDNSRNRGNNAYRNHYRRLMAWGNNTSELRGGRMYNCGDNSGGSLGIGNDIDQYYLVPVGADRPRITARLIASTSMARYSASRTRMSWNGFLPLTLEY